MRWKLGEEPDVEGNNTEDGYVNIKMEVLEDDANKTNQRDLLGGGAVLRMRCDKCNEVLHIAAAKDAVAVLKEGGIEYRGSAREATVVAAVCLNGHVTQLWEDMARRLVA